MLHYICFVKYQVSCVWDVQNIEKLEKVVNEGNYYGAQQMYKSVSARFVQFLRVTYSSREMYTVYFLFLIQSST